MVLAGRNKVERRHPARQTGEVLQATVGRAGKKVKALLELCTTTVHRKNPEKKSIQALKTGLVRFSLRRRIVALYLCDPDVPRPRCDVVGRREGQTDGRGVAAAAADVNVD